MQYDREKVRTRSMIFMLLGAIIAPVDAYAYIDPGTTGVLSQVLYVLFYGALGLFLYTLRSFKQYLANLRRFLARLLGRRSQ